MPEEKKIEIHVTSLVIIIFIILLLILFYLFCKNNTNLIKVSESTQSMEEAIHLISNIIQQVIQTCPVPDTSKGEKITPQGCPQLAAVFNALEQSTISNDTTKYFFIIDTAGNMIVNGGNPSMATINNVRPVQNLSTIQAIKDIISKASTGGGYIRYTWPKPDTKTPCQKESYVKLIPGTTFIIGVGSYK